MSSIASLNEMLVYKLLKSNVYTMRLLNNLGVFYYKKRQKFLKAAKCLLKVLNIGKYLFGENNFEMASIMNSFSRLNEMFESRNKKRIALIYCEKAFFILTNLLGPTHEITVSTFQRYQNLLNKRKP